jgi:RNA polymerase sigma-70 factor (ECF subfamily)
MNDYSDKELMKLVVARDTQAFKILYNRFNVQIFNFVLRLTGRRELAQDLLQETFTRVWFAAHTFDLKKGNFKGWIYKIALNTTRNEMSKKQYEYHYEDWSQICGTSQEPYLAATDQPDSKLFQSELKAIIAEALGKLNPLFREIIFLKHYQQLKFKEIAEMTNTPEGTLKARFHHGIARLKELLEPLDL